MKPDITNALNDDFFSRDASTLAVDLLGKVIHHMVDGICLKAFIIETESYYIKDKGSHASLGRTLKRDALFSKPGTIYMYYARGNDSLNFSALGDGNAVLIKSCFPFTDDKIALGKMLKMNPSKNGSLRPFEKLCAGQTLLCKALGLKVSEYDGKKHPLTNFFVTDSNIDKGPYLQTLRLGIPEGRDEELWQRFVLKDYAKFCTSNPLTKRGSAKGKFREFKNITDIDFKRTAKDR